MTMTSNASSIQDLINALQQQLAPRVPNLSNAEMNALHNLCQMIQQEFPMQVAPQQVGAGKRKAPVKKWTLTGSKAHYKNKTYNLYTNAAGEFAVKMQSGQRKIFRRVHP